MESGLLVDFPYEGLLDRLPNLDGAAWQAPNAVVGPLLQQNFP